MQFDIINESTILYVEDDKNISSIIVSSMQLLCKKILIASDGQEGLNLYKQHKDEIDIIITDLNMPRLNGIEMIESIRNLNYDIPIVITSAFGDENMLKKVINLGVDGFVAKPLIVVDLLKIIERSLKPVFYKKELHKKDTLIFQQSKLAAIGEMIGNIAHQWRQPLNSIGVTMMKLEFNNENNNLTKESITEVINNTNEIVSHMSKTIDDFRNSFLPNKEKIKFKIKDSIHNILTLMTPQLTTHNVDIKVTGDPNISFFGYKNELKQVLINIISNAKDAIINNKNISNGLIQINIQVEQNNILITVQDNAGGVPKELIHKIFEPYFTTKFKSQGTGLGLYMSKVIIEKNMDGHIYVENITDGAIFYINLPLKD